MSISEKELFEIIGRQQVQIFIQMNQITAHQKRAIELQKAVEKTDKEGK